MFDFCPPPDMKYLQDIWNRNIDKSLMFDYVYSIILP
jgi:hypothetical protein